MIRHAGNILEFSWSQKSTSNDVPILPSYCLISLVGTRPFYELLPSLRNLSLAKSPPISDFIPSSGGSISHVLHFRRALFNYKLQELYSLLLGACFMKMLSRNQTLRPTSSLSLMVAVTITAITSIKVSTNRSNINSNEQF